MPFFSIFRAFFSHQNVQMITGPHEKKWCGKIFWGPFLNKIHFFKKKTALFNFQDRELKFCIRDILIQMQIFCTIRGQKSKKVHFRCTLLYTVRYEYTLKNKFFVYCNKKKKIQIFCSFTHL